MSWQAAAWFMLGGSTALMFLGLPVAFSFLVINLIGAKAPDQTVTLDVYRGKRQMTNPVVDVVGRDVLEVARQTGVSRSCHRRTPSSGARPCSTNRSLPPGRSTRRISASALAACGIEHKVQVVTMVSTLCLSSGMASAEASRKLTGMLLAREALRAIAISRGAGSSARTSRTGGR